jgi:hypothetical protein
VTLRDELTKLLADTSLESVQEARTLASAADLVQDPELRVALLQLRTQAMNRAIVMRAAVRKIEVV